MLSRLIPALFLFVIASPALASEPDATAYDFEFTAIEGGPLPMSAYRGKVVLVVNTASFCGFTDQYRALRTVWERYEAEGLVVLGVPSNDFGNQEPGSAAEIKTFCTLNYGIEFPLTEKVRVKGEKAHPFYKWAAEELGAKAAPRWNFHKYLVGPKGNLVNWFGSPVPPTAPEVTQAIEAQLERVALR